MDPPPEGKGASASGTHSPTQAKGVGPICGGGSRRCMLKHLTSVSQRENLDRSMSDRQFQPNHERRLLTTFRHVDELVSQAVSRLDTAANAPPLSEFLPDGTPDQQKLAAGCLDELREAMRRFLYSHQIPLPERRVSALWAAHSACLHAQLSVEELRPSSMRGCGKLTPEAERELETLVAGLSEVLQKLSDFLARAAQKSD
jgi:hypothetical protein